MSAETGGPTADLGRIPDAQSPEGVIVGHGPPYPLVLCHGFYGFDQVAGIEYFYGVKGALKAAGHQIFTTAVNPFQNSRARGEQLIVAVQQVLAETGSAQVNLIGHSQGGLDARYVASQIPDRVGAVVTISTPNHGAYLGDIFAGNVPGLSSELTRELLRLVSRPIYGDISQDADMAAALEGFASDAVAAFNAEFPDQRQVAYYSISGVSNLVSTDHPLCGGGDSPAFISRYAGARDTMDPLLLSLAVAVGGNMLDPAPNDGMVRVASAKWGKWLGCVPADHLDEIGQVLGDSPGLGNAFDYLEFYVELGAYLGAQGH